MSVEANYSHFVETVILTPEYSPEQCSESIERAFIDLNERCNELGYVVTRYDISTQGVAGRHVIYIITAQVIKRDMLARMQSEQKFGIRPVK